MFSFCTESCCSTLLQSWACLVPPYLSVILGEKVTYDAWVGQEEFTGPAKVPLTGDSLDLPATGVQLTVVNKYNFKAQCWKGMLLHAARHLVALLALYEP